MSKAPRSLQNILIPLVFFLAVFGWSWSQLSERPVNADGWASDWLDPKVWLKPLANHESLGQAAVNLGALRSVTFTDNQHGWAVGYDGVILATTDGGGHWQAPTSPVNTWLNSVHFTDAQHGWAVGGDGIIIATSDGGLHWQAQTSPVEDRLISVHFADAQHGWAVGWNGVILATTDGGEHWQAQTSPVNSSIDSIHFIDAQHGWAVGQNAVIIATTDGGGHWQSQTSPDTTYLSSVHFTDTQHGWAVGVNGVILATTDGGGHWQVQTSSVEDRLISVHFTDAQHGWAVGSDGVIIATTDGGTNWQIIPIDPSLFGQSRPKLATYPSPAALLLLFFSTLLLARNIYRYYAEPRSLQGGISDAPIERAEHDCLGRIELVKTLADLIRNRDTVPPLAIAITAPWGSGKSSMLGLLRDELKDEVFTVYLNAWHYRDDGQLLAALMEHIRDQALPPAFSWDNIVFRSRLLGIRWFSKTKLSVIGVLVLGLIIAWFYGLQHNWQFLSIWLKTQQLTLPMPTWLSPKDSTLLVS